MKRGKHGCVPHKVRASSNMRDWYLKTVSWHDFPTKTTVPVPGRGPVVRAEPGARCVHCGDPIESSPRDAETLLLKEA